MTPRLILIPLLTLMAAANAASALAQDKGTVNPKPLPPLANPNDPKIGAKELFGRKVLPAAMPTRVLGFYAHGCIAGAEGLPINGDNWQVMRLSRNRYWGIPIWWRWSSGWPRRRARMPAGPGILVGDMSQPRGGPMFTGHASHQVGLDADIWLTPMPTRQLSRNEREEMSAVMMVRADRLDIDAERLDADASCGDPRGRAGADRAAHLRQCRDQEGAVPRSQGRSPPGSTRCGRCTATTITSTSASDARPAAANARPSPIRIGRRRLQRRRSRLLVQRCGAAPEAAHGAAKAETADDDGGAAAACKAVLAAPDAKQ